MNKPGDRVGAILSANENIVNLLGYGIYEGNFIPEDDKILHPIFGIPIKELNIPNPRIKLDSGDVVWGCQCWWGAEDRVKASIDSRLVRIVNTDGEILG